MKIQAKIREITGKKVKNLRKEGILPASVYGPKRKSANITVDNKEFIKTFKEQGYSKFIDLEIEGEKPVKVLVKEAQIHPILNKVLSVSFYQVDEDSKLTVAVPITFVGESPAIKLNLGFLIHQMDQIVLHCLPKYLPNEVTVDISTLDQAGSAITVGDIKLPENVDLDSSMEPTTAVVYIGTAQKEEEEVKPATETAEGETPAAGTEAAPATPAATEEKK